MFELNRLVFVLFSLFSGVAIARNGCRQCHGNQVVLFTDYMSYEDFRNYVTGTVGLCATGDQYSMDQISSSNCISKGGVSACKEWRASYQVWRYCGNGGKLDLRRVGICVGNVCGVDDQLSMSCVKSVDCASKCHCILCGC